MTTRHTEVIDEGERTHTTASWRPNSHSWWRIPVTQDAWLAALVIQAGGVDMIREVEFEQ